MRTQTVASLLQRFKKDDLHIVAKSWSVICSRPNGLRNALSQELNGSNGKKKFIGAVLKILRKETIKDRNVGELDLLFTTNYPASKHWSMFKLERIPGRSRSAVRSHEHLERLLQKQLDNFHFKHVVITLIKDEAVWIYVNIIDNKRGELSLTNATYLVHCLKTDYVCVANLKAAYKSALCQAIINILHCGSMQSMDLEGRCVKSLMSIALQQNSQEIERSRSKDNQFPASRKRKASDQETDEYSNRIKQENAAEKRRCQEFVRKRFGDGPQPILERVSYALETNFHGGSNVPGELQNTVVRCHVKFDGPNVLEGIKNLALVGIADVPMKDHLSRIKSLARNKFRIMPRTSGTRKT